MNTDALEAFADGRKVPEQKPSWRPPQSEDFVVPEHPNTRAVVAVDQSISGCAAVLLGATRVRDHMEIAVARVKKFATTPVEEGGYEETLQRAVELHGELMGWLVDTRLRVGHIPIEIVHELPPIGGGKLVRPESSLLSALALRIAASKGESVAPMVAPQTHKHFTCGDRKADKRDSHRELLSFADNLGIKGLDLITNEDLRDALSIGLYHLTRPAPEEHHD